VAAIPVSLLAARAEGGPADLRLAAYLYRPQGGHSDTPTPAPQVPGLVVGHGAGSRASRHEQFCLEACRHGFAVLALDFRGHGDSAGSGDGPLELDVLAAVRYLREHPAVDPRLICYRGSSMGGFYGLKAAARAAFAAMVLLCPASETTMLRAIVDDEDSDARRDTEAPEGTDTSAGVESPGDAIPRWDMPRLRAYFERQSTGTLAAQVACPVLLIHARGDDVVPLEHSLMLARHMRTDTTVLALEGGSHTTAQQDPSIHVYSAAWLRDRVAPARAK
jgi:dipeptidyl aminopeptidase/acylaminoacyl peptidase